MQRDIELTREQENTLQQARRVVIRGQDVAETRAHQLGSCDVARMRAAANEIRRAGDDADAVLPCHPRGFERRGKLSECAGVAVRSCDAVEPGVIMTRQHAVETASEL